MHPILDLVHLSSPKRSSLWQIFIVNRLNSALVIAERFNLSKDTHNASKSVDINLGLVGFKVLMKSAFSMKDRLEEAFAS